jgi:hypothetical protein
MTIREGGIGGSPRLLAGRTGVIVGDVAYAVAAFDARSARAAGRDARARLDGRIGARAILRCTGVDRRTAGAPTREQHQGQNKVEQP